MIQGLPSSNIHLYISINNQPYNSVKDFHSVLNDENSNFIVTVDKNG